MKLEDCGLELSAYLTDERGHITWFCYEDTDTDRVYVGGLRDLEYLKIMLHHRATQRENRERQDRTSHLHCYIDQEVLNQLQDRIVRERIARERAMIWGYLTPGTYIAGYDPATTADQLPSEPSSGFVTTTVPRTSYQTYTLDVSNLSSGFNTLQLQMPNSAARNITLHTSEAGMQLLTQAIAEELGRQVNPPRE